jgi:chemotaxis family two-component system sensor kinase Cph1
MAPSDRSPSNEEIERLRRELESETQQCVDLRRKVDLAHAEFEEFISLAAHALREPLRDVASYGQLIAENYAGRLGADADIFLGRIREGAAQAQGLLAEVVDFWSVGSGEQPSSTADMEAALRQALLLAGKLIVERGAVVSHDPLPCVRGDSVILSKVLYRLIANAIEYCDSTGPRVHVSSDRANGGWVLSIKDNGPGIDPLFQERIFCAFKRLHGKEYPGNGLGLAFCKRAIEWQGGHLWLSSQPGAGSTFYLSLLPPG